jgi:hypothetical protein
MEVRMRLALALAALCVLTAAPVRATVLETEPRTFPVAAHQRVRLEFPVGQLKVIPTDDARVRFDLRVRCHGGDESRCEELADRLVLDSDDEGNTLHLKLHKYPQWHNHGMTVMGELRVPRSLAVQIEMGVGELDIDGIEGDLDVELGVGEAAIRAMKAHAGHVSVETGIGDANIHGGGSDTESHGFIGSHATWTAGNGHSAVRLHVGVGEGTVRLE